VQSNNVHAAIKRRKRCQFVNVRLYFTAIMNVNKITDPSTEMNVDKL